MIAITMIPGATTIMPRVTLPPLIAATTPPPAATSTSKNVPQVSAKMRRHSREESKKSSANCRWTIRCCCAGSGRSCLVGSMAPVQCYSRVALPNHWLDGRTLNPHGSHQTEPSARRTDELVEDLASVRSIYISKIHEGCEADRIEARSAYEESVDLGLGHETLRIVRLD